ncbi:hypothetical protein Psi01_51340 [Planobispora siamensis]|uniref:Uncharacterized protein n=1 Tax=Planobispora siamensis TaxID=936338 RepID=A0A8J3WKT4_9ACTN|nr:hypothetical protein Psi01_51340 [Planobispora siamensis]
MTGPAVGDDGDLAVVGCFETGRQPQQGGLPAAVLAHDPGALAGPDGEGDVVEDQAVAVGLTDAPQGQLSRQG